MNTKDTSATNTEYDPEPLAVRSNDKLGPLPEPFAVHELWGQNVNVYTAGQMLAYALLERERCAVVCETIGKDIVCPEECASAIRGPNAKLIGPSEAKGHTDEHH